MSDYTRLTRHPQTGVYEHAKYYDNYFGSHLYGVEFSSDKKVYPVEIVQKARLFTFWIEDVIEGFKTFMEQETGECNNTMIEDFLFNINDEYKARWKRDPLNGEGATEWLKLKSAGKI